MLVEDCTTEDLGSPPDAGLAKQDFLEEPYPTARSRDVLGAVVSQLWWGALLRTRGLAAVVKTVQRRSREPRPSRAHPDRQIAAIISGFSSASLLLPPADRCLVRALALHHLCWRRGIRAVLVFGVRMNPFRAHCWVQLADRILIGEFEQVRLFTPIAVLG
jgi:hypothetical protein